MPNRDLFPEPSRGGRISLDNDYKRDFKWTPSKGIFYAVCIGTPYLVAVIATVLAGMEVVAAILIGLAVFSGLIAVLLRWLEKASF